MNKTIFTIIFLIIALLVTSKIRSFVENNTPDDVVKPVEEVTFCTMDAMMCPDGTYVGRTGPLCEFKCPEASTTIGSAIKILGLNESFEFASTTISVSAVTEDSRCPSDVVCIQMGQVKVMLIIESPSGGSNIEMGVGDTTTTENLSITLDEVLPYPVSSHKIVENEYRFKFNIKINE